VGLVVDRKKIVDRVKALHAKTVVNGCTEGEALSARAKAQELMAAHNISEAELAGRPHGLFADLWGEEISARWQGEWEQRTRETPRQRAAREAQWQREKAEQEEREARWREEERQKRRAKKLNELIDRFYYRSLDVRERIEARNKALDELVKFAEKNNYELRDIDPKDWEEYQQWLRK
jgi:flagellar motility protein MotE (MotC chaperone)